MDDSSSADIKIADEPKEIIQTENNITDSSSDNKALNKEPKADLINRFLNRIGPEPQVKIWFTFLPFYMSLVFLFFVYLLHYPLNNKGVAQSFIIFFEITIPILFVIYSIVLVVISLMKVKIRSKNIFYSASLFLSITFIFSILCLFLNQGFVDGNFISTDYSGIYLLSAAISTIDVLYIFNRIRGIVILMIGEYSIELPNNAE